MKMKSPTRLEPGRLAGCRVANVDRLERGLAVGRNHLGAVEHVDVRSVGELLDEIVRHALLEALAAVEDGDAPRMGREEQRRLTR